MIIGGEDEKLIEGEQVAKLEMKSNEHFIVEMDNLHLGKYKIAENVLTLLDTGNTLICIPLKHKKVFGDALEAQGIHCDLYKESNPDFHQVGCVIKQDLSNAPKFVFTLGGVEFTMPKHSLIDRCRRREDLDKRGEMLCLIKIEMQKGGMYFILGKHWFLKNYRKGIFV